MNHSRGSPPSQVGLGGAIESLQAERDNLAERVRQLEGMLAKPKRGKRAEWIGWLYKRIHPRGAFRWEKLNPNAALRPSWSIVKENDSVVNYKQVRITVEEI